MMLNEQMAEMLEDIAEYVIEEKKNEVYLDDDDVQSLRAGAEALRDVGAIKKKWRREECAHCNMRSGGTDGTIWCAECLNWWKQESANEALRDAFREVERLRGTIEWAVGILQQCPSVGHEWPATATMPKCYGSVLNNVPYVVLDRLAKTVSDEEEK